MKKCKTTGELIEALKEFPLDSAIVIDGADCGSDDVTSQPVCVVQTVDEAYPIVGECHRFFAPKNPAFLSGIGLARPSTAQELKWNSSEPEKFMDWWDLKQREE